mgnify:CR=1 FL=1
MMGNTSVEKVLVLDIPLQKWLKKMKLCVPVSAPYSLKFGHTESGSHHFLFLSFVRDLPQSCWHSRL